MINSVWLVNVSGFPQEVLHTETSGAVDFPVTRPYLVMRIWGWKRRLTKGVITGSVDAGVSHQFSVLRIKKKKKGLLFCLPVE